MYQGVNCGGTPDGLKMDGPECGIGMRSGK